MSGAQVGGAPGWVAFQGPRRSCHVSPVHVVSGLSKQVLVQPEPLGHVGQKVEAARR